MTQPRFQPMPPLTDDEYAALREDIRANGLIYPIQTDEDGNILDGHNRERICKELGILPRYEVRRDLDDEAKWNFALRAQIRRNLTPDQKRDLIRNELQRRRERSDRDIATALGVDARTVQRQRHLLFDPPDPIIPNPRVLPSYVDLQDLTLDYPMDALDATEKVEEYEKYVLWCGERTLAYYATLDLSARHLTIPLAILMLDALAVFKLFDWQTNPQAASLWARLSVLCDAGKAAQETRMRALDDAAIEAEMAEHDAEWEAVKWNEWNWRGYFLTALREGPGDGNEDAA